MADTRTLRVPSASESSAMPGGGNTGTMSGTPGAAMPGGGGSSIGMGNPNFGGLRQYIGSLAYNQSPTNGSSPAQMAARPAAGAAGANNTPSVFGQLFGSSTMGGPGGPQPNGNPVTMPPWLMSMPGSSTMGGPGGAQRSSFNPNGGSGGPYTTNGGFNPNNGGPEQNPNPDNPMPPAGGGPGGSTAPGQNPYSGQYTPPGVQTIASDPLWGKLFSIPTMPGDIGQFRNQLLSYLWNNVGGMQASAPPNPGQVSAGPSMLLNQQFGSYIPTLDRTGIQNVNAPTIGNQGTQTQSLDQLLGPNSQFGQTIMNQLQPMFNQQRDMALAQAKESAGNLTGSGLANTMSSTLANLLTGQNQSVMNYLLQAGQSEQARQAQQANLAQEQNVGNAQLGQQAGMANQGADISFLNQLLQRGQLGNTAQQMGLSQGVANQQNQLAYDTTNAQLAQQNNLSVYDTLANLANNNAQRLSALSSQLGTAGVGPNQVASQAGAGALIPAAASIIGQLLGSQGKDGQSLGSQLLGYAGQGVGAIGGLIGQGLGSIWNWLTGGGGGSNPGSPGGSTLDPGGEIGSGYQTMGSGMMGTGYNTGNPFGGGAPGYVPNSNWIQQNLPRSFPAGPGYYNGKPTGWTNVPGQGWVYTG